MGAFHITKSPNKSHRPFPRPVGAAKLVSRNEPESGEKRNKGKARQGKEGRPLEILSRGRVHDTTSKTIGAAHGAGTTS